jgi:hypothetical protein
MEARRSKGGSENKKFLIHQKLAVASAAPSLPTPSVVQTVAAIKPFLQIWRPGLGRLVQSASSTAVIPLLFRKNLPNAPGVPPKVNRMPCGHQLSKPHGRGVLCGIAQGKLRQIQRFASGPCSSVFAGGPSPSEALVGPRRPPSNPSADRGARRRALPK